LEKFDVVVIGAGGAGLFCAMESAKRGRRTALLDHAPKPGAKILVSGGGRCNFTNLGAGPENYVSQNPHFCKSALSRFTPRDFTALVEKHRVPFHEKKAGQLFCDRSAKDILGMLLDECGTAGARLFMGRRVVSILRHPSQPSLPAPASSGSGGFLVRTDLGDLSCHSLVIATGGLSIPKLGATDFGHGVARQFGLGVVPPRPALDGFRLSGADLERFGDLTGVSLDARMACGETAFREALLFTHAGLSGPAALQLSLYWNDGDPVRIDFLPDFGPGDLENWFGSRKRKGEKTEMGTLLGELLPKRLADRLCAAALPPRAALSGVSPAGIRGLCGTLQAFTVLPSSTVGYGKAEVTRGGVDTRELSSQTMESRKVPGLYFIGEVVDVTGQLGGYNFQWAWSSGWAAGQSV
jgi:predicted Rossmann fold flavoprotein